MFFLQNNNRRLLMIVKKEMIIDQKRFKAFIRLTIFFEKQLDDIMEFTSNATINGTLVKHPYMVTNKMLPVVLKLDNNARPTDIQVDENEKRVTITIDTLTANLLVEQNRTTGKYNGCNKIVFIKKSNDALERNDLYILQSLVENYRRK